MGQFEWPKELWDSNRQGYSFPVLMRLIAKAPDTDWGENAWYYYPIDNKPEQIYASSIRLNQRWFKTKSEAHQGRIKHLEQMLNSITIELSILKAECKSESQTNNEQPSDNSGNQNTQKESQDTP